MNQQPAVKRIDDLRVKLFADGADKTTMLEMYRRRYIKGFTTNPTLMRKAGVTDYEYFARDVLEQIRDVPISFEVFADEAEEMLAQGRVMASWGENVYVKVPVTNTQGVPEYAVIRELARSGIKVNVTAVMTLEQVDAIAEALRGGAPACVSVFAGRIADTGRDPVPLMQEALAVLAAGGNAELIWASPREVLNVLQADAIGCQIITATADILAKLELLGKDLGTYSLETVRMFHKDALASGYSVGARRAAHT